MAMEIEGKRAGAEKKLTARSQGNGHELLAGK